MMIAVKCVEKIMIMKRKQRIKPCDCKDLLTANKLKEQGISWNDQSIMVEPSVVVLKMGHTTIRIPQSTFKLFAEWYLTEQEID